MIFAPRRHQNTSFITSYLTSEVKCSERHGFNQKIELLTISDRGLDVGDSTYHFISCT